MPGTSKTGCHPVVITFPLGAFVFCPHHHVASLCSGICHGVPVSKKSVPWCSGSGWLSLYSHSQCL